MSTKLFSKHGITKVANNRYEFKNNVVESFLKGVTSYQQLQEWAKKF